MIHDRCSCFHKITNELRFLEANLTKIALDDFKKIAILCFTLMVNSLKKKVYIHDQNMPVYPILQKYFNSLGIQRGYTDKYYSNNHSF